MITILIPTLDRSEFVFRSLNYYARVGFTGTIIIGDSSEDEHSGRIQSLVNKLHDELNIVYRYFPKAEYLHDGMCMKEMIDMVETPYAVYSGDDDFLIPNSLNKCAEFLEEHSDFSAAHGFRANITLNNSGPFGNIKKASIVSGQNLESDSAVERFVAYMHHGISTQYYLHRKETWQSMYREVNKVPSRYLGPELLPCCLTNILGKVKLLECLTCVFQKNDNQIFDWGAQSMFDLINHKYWHTSIKVLQKRLAAELIEQDGLSRENAERIAERELWGHLGTILITHFKKRHDRENIIIKKKENVLYTELLNPSFPFYSDFRTVYLSVISKLEKESCEEAAEIEML